MFQSGGKIDFASDYTEVHKVYFVEIAVTGSAIGWSHCHVCLGTKKSTLILERSLYEDRGFEARCELSLELWLGKLSTMLKIKILCGQLYTQLPRILPLQIHLFSICSFYHISPLISYHYTLCPIKQSNIPDTSTTKPRKRM
jgi:hypothetical protein